MPKKPKQGTEPETALIPIERIEQRIYVIRGHKVMLDRDLAELYQVKAIALRQQVKRNRSRFPDDFTFQLTTSEAENLVSQSVIASKRSFGGSLPYAFTEQGVAMLSAVLNSDRAVQVSIAIVRGHWPPPCSATSTGGPTRGIRWNTAGGTSWNSVVA